MENYQIHDLVALLEPLEKANLPKGQVGTIVEILDVNNTFLVEFADKRGETITLVPLSKEQVLLLHLNSELAA